MTIGKRKGFTVKGAGAAIGSPGAVNKEVGGSLSKSDHFYLQEGFGMSFDPGVAPFGLEATGGLVSNYNTPTGAYRAHIFNGPGTFQVTKLSETESNTIEYLVVGGGGGGGAGQVSNEGAGGGGAGGLRTGSQTAIVTTYPISVGPGGLMGVQPEQQASVGARSYFVSPTHPTLPGVASEGGGVGLMYNSGPNTPLMPGGSGGGGFDGQPGGTENRVAATSASTVPAQGNAGGASGTNKGGGGGGAGAAGSSSEHPTTPSQGGAGAINDYATGADIYYAGGGGGANYPGPGGAAGGAGGGGGAAPNPSYANDGHPGTGSLGGGGGGGAADPTNWGFGGKGGSGCVIVRYKLGDADAGSTTAQATGGYISKTPTKTVHTFDRPGTFTSPTALTIDLLMVGGGGGGASDNGGGGGGGEVIIGTSYPLPASPTGRAITVGEGGAGGHGDTPPSGTLAHHGQRGHAGFPSTFNSLIARGGGGGGGAGHRVDPGASANRAWGTANPLGQGQVGNGGGGSGTTDPGGSLDGYNAPSNPQVPTAVPQLSYYAGGIQGPSDPSPTTGGIGGIGSGPNGYNAGGGAGAGAPGVPGAINSYPTTASDGGVGVESSILGTPYFWGGGGGGGCYVHPTAPVSSMAGGKGGGGGGAGTTPSGPTGRSGWGDGGADTLYTVQVGGNPNDIYGPNFSKGAAPGCASTGGGGGGGGRNDIMSGNGGSGIVVIAYPT